MNTNITILKKYLQLIEVFTEDAEALNNVLDPNVEFVEYPNAINPKGQVRHLAQALKGLEMGRKILAWQKYEISEILENADRLFVEALWSGQVAIDVGHLKKDQKLSAHCAIRFDFEHGKIIRQVNYDCYEPFA